MYEDLDEGERAQPGPLGGSKLIPKKIESNKKAKRENAKANILENKIKED